MQLTINKTQLKSITTFNHKSSTLNKQTNTNKTNNSQKKYKREHINLSKYTFDKKNSKKIKKGSIVQKPLFLFPLQPQTYINKNKTETLTT